MFSPPRTSTVTSVIICPKTTYSTFPHTIMLISILSRCITGRSYSLLGFLFGNFVVELGHSRACTHCFSYSFSDACFLHPPETHLGSQYLAEVVYPVIHHDIRKRWHQCFASPSNQVQGQHTECRSSVKRQGGAFPCERYGILAIQTLACLFNNNLVITTNAITWTASAVCCHPQ